MELSTILVSLASSVVVALFTYVGVIHRAKADLEMKRLEMRESRRQIVLEEFMRNADGAIQSGRLVYLFEQNFSPALLYMNRKQAKLAIELLKTIKDKEAEKARNLLAELCESLR